MERFNPYSPPTNADPPMAQPVQSSDVTATVVEHLRQTKPWVTFLAVIGFIGVGLMVLGGGFLLFLGGDVGMPAGIGLAYMLIAALYVAPSVFLLRYGQAIGVLLKGGGVPALEDALGHQKSFWRFVGILMAILMGLYALILVIGVVAAVATL